MSGLRHVILAKAILALVFAGPNSAFAQEDKKLTDTFEQRYPPRQVPTQPPSEQPPTQPPAERHDAQPNRRPETLQNRSQEAAQRKKFVTMPKRAVSARRSPSRVVVGARSFLDAGTEVLPGERKFLDYAFRRTQTPMDVVTNTGGRVGWHNSPLPGPLFPGYGPW